MKKAWKRLLVSLLALTLLVAVGLPVLATGAGEGAAQGEPAPDSSGLEAPEDGPELPVEEPRNPEEGAGQTDAPPPAGEESGTTEPPEEEPLPGEAAADEGMTEEAEADEETPQAYGLQVGENGIVVGTYAELKQALGEDNGFTTIYLGANITAENGTIPIHPGKAAVVIDGSPPEGGRHTFTQPALGGQNGVFTADAAGSRTTGITLRNLDVVGKTDIGVVRAGSGAVITLENVHYTGPQALYHRGGTVRVIGGSYTLPGGELAEALHAELGGALSVEGPPANAVLWLTGGASTLRVLPGADVQINTSNYFVYGTIAAAHLEAGARLSLTSRRFGFSYAADSVGTFTIAEGAKLHIDLHTTESYAALRVSRRFEMAPGSSAVIVRTGTAGISLRLSAAGAVAVFNQPQRVLFYSGAGVPLRFTGAGTLSVTTTALNVWQSAAWPLAGGMAALPSQLWNKAGDEPLTVEGSYYETANRGLTHNLTAGDPATSALDANSFNLEKSQLLAFGAGSLGVDAPAATTAALTGKSTPGAELLAAYTLAGGQAGTAGGAADAAGQYRLPLTGGALEAGSDVTVTSRWDDLFLRKTAVVQQAEEGRLAFLAVPERVSFGVPPIPGAPVYVERQQAEFEITVQDTRAQPLPWRIDASLAAGGDAALPPAGAVVFTTKDGEVLRLGEAPQTVYRHTEAAGGTISVLWGQGEGVLLDVVPGAIYSDREYNSAIHWTLVDAP